MSTQAITFDQLERSADNTLAWVLWAKAAKNALTCALIMAILSRLLQSFVASLTPQRLTALSPEQAKDFKGRLQELHGHLMMLLRHRSCDVLRSSALFRSSILRLEDSSEDVGDIIEDLVLANNPQFTNLVGDCVEALSHAHAVGSVGLM